MTKDKIYEEYYLKVKFLDSVIAQGGFKNGKKIRGKIKQNANNTNKNKQIQRWKMGSFQNYHNRHKTYQLLQKGIGVERCIKKMNGLNG